MENSQTVEEVRSRESHKQFCVSFSNAMIFFTILRCLYQAIFISMKSFPINYYFISQVQINIEVFYCSNVLERQLFTTRTTLQGCILYVRSLCLDASGSHIRKSLPSSIIKLIHLDVKVTLTLEEFKKVQQKQTDHALIQINRLRNNIVDTVWNACLVSLST